MAQRNHLFMAAAMLAAVLGGGWAAGAQTADQAWLRYQDHQGRILIPFKVRALGAGVLEQSATSELRRSIADFADRTTRAFRKRFGGFRRRNRFRHCR